MVPMEPETPIQAPPGWYPDFWTPSRKRYWTGTSWTFATEGSAAFDDPPPVDPSPLPDGHGLPAPVVRRPAAGAPGGAPAEKPKRPILWVLAVIVGLLVGLAGVALSTRSSSDPDPSPSGSATGPVPTTAPAIPPTSGSPAGNDPSAEALAALVVKPEDVPATARVVILPGGIGLSQPTLDLCNSRYPSESRRTARIQDAALNAEGTLVLSTEAVLYADSGGTSQALSETRAVAAGCPSTPVPGPIGEPPVTTRFGAAPDGSWPQTPSVNRLAYDVTTDDGSGQPPRRTVVVYLQRGRVLLGVYFARPDGPQVPVEGQTTIEGIVGVFAARVAALPTSVVGT